MSLAVIDEQYLSDTADAIREKTGDTALLRPSEFADAISSISGGGGLEYETGIFVPSEDSSRPEILFANHHDEAPFFIVMIDMGDTVYNSTTSMSNFIYLDYLKALGHGFVIKSGTVLNSIVLYNKKTTATTNSMVMSNNPLPNTSSDDTEDTSAYPRYYAKEDAFYPSTYSGKSVIAGRTYKWMAIWMPTV